MSDHERYEELAALSVGGFLSDQENVELREHVKLCPECLKTQAEFGELVRSGLPLTESRVREFLQCVRTRSDSGIRERFLQRARGEGVIFSPDVYEPGSPQAKRLVTLVSVSAALAAIVLLTVYATVISRRATLPGAQSKEQLEQLQQQNSALNATLAQLNESLAAQQNEIQNLRVRLGTANRTADSLRNENEQARSQVERSSSQNVPLSAELQNRENQLDDARKEVARINQLHADDEANLVAQQVRIAELSDQLRVASATLDLERQLTAAGKDIRELLTARQLHVIDVRDTDANGKPSKAFGRVFVTEGKSLTFYAFDLNEERPIDGKHGFEVWGTQQAEGSPPQKLGFLYVDDKAQRRWALKVNDPQLVKEVNSVFVTVEPSGGTPAPNGRAMLYAYIGQPNHP
jgi:predicted  nucleic acid-binding Zn-ribbon protein